MASRLACYGIFVVFGLMRPAPAQPEVLPIVSELSFRVVSTATGNLPGKVPVLLGIRNVGTQRFDLSTRGQPLIWQLSYERADAKGTLHDISTQVMIRTHTILEGDRYCPHEGDVLVLEPGNEVFLNVELDLDVLQAATYEVNVGVVLMRLPQKRAECIEAHYVRGKVTTLIQIRGDKATFVTPTSASGGTQGGSGGRPPK